MKFKFTLLLMMLLPLLAHAQGITIQGTVVDDSDGEPMPGVTVTIEGTNKTTATDFDGQYVIKADKAGTLVFTFVGMTPERRSFTGSTTINVRMSEDARVLNEVVVVGYGTMRKSDLTGSVSSISADKLNQLRHVKFLHDADGIAEHMKKHAAILRPKFQLVLRKLEEGLADVGGCSWSKPRGGYFVSFDAPEGTAKRIVTLAKEAGVTMTGAGATWPHKDDPRDSNIRIAPTLPPLEELEAALDIFVCCVKLAYAEKLVGE